MRERGSPPTMRTGGVHYLFAKASTPTGNQNLSKVAGDGDGDGDGGCGRCKVLCTNCVRLADSHARSSSTSAPITLRCMQPLQRASGVRFRNGSVAVSLGLEVSR